MPAIPPVPRPRLRIEEEELIGEKMEEEGVVLDLGEGISLNIPIKKRMSITDFLKVAEKVKALESLSEDHYRHKET